MSSSSTNTHAIHEPLSQRIHQLSPPCVERVNLPQSPASLGIYGMPRFQRADTMSAAARGLDRNELDPALKPGSDAPLSTHRRQR